MAEFTDVIKHKKRMCEKYNCTHDCPIKKWVTSNYTKTFYGCTRIMEHPQEAEEIIMKWAKEHPIVTNADKFKEVFGFTPNGKSCPYTIDSCGDSCDKSNCSHYDFWEQEYKEPKEVEE